MLKVEIFDTMPLYSEGIVSLLGRNGIDVVVAGDLGAGLSPLPPDVCVIDPSVVDKELLPDFVVTASRGAPVLLLVPDAENSVRYEAMAIGIAGCVERRARPEAFLTVVCSVAGQRPRTGPDPRWDCPAAEKAPLSPRERQVIQQIACGLTHGQIANRLAISQHTVDTYVKRIRSKMNLGNKAELTRAAVLGLMSGR
jgi:DNA-binding NarL/FixJ family response regulator